jgi:RNA polymerase sigma-70 factor (ECF subfamily)
VGLAETWLVWRLKRGDGDACRELIRRHHQAVYGFLRRLGADQALSEDLTQETYARAWSRVSGLREAVSLRAWLLAIARNEFLQLARRKGIEEVPMEDDPGSADPAPGALGGLENRQRDARLHRAVDRLEPALRETVALHYFQDLSLREVGVVLGLPPGTVKSRLNRALEALRGELDREKEANHEQPANREAS